MLPPLCDAIRAASGSPININSQASNAESRAFSMTLGGFGKPLIFSLLMGITHTHSESLAVTYPLKISA